MTIKDIAKESGYSVSTVSRVLNNRDDVSPEAEKKIRRIVAEHNFVPNGNAKHLKQIASKTICVLIKGTSNMVFSGIAEEIQTIVNKTSYTLNMIYLDEEENEVEQAIIQCRERKPLGILFLGGNPAFFREKFHEVKVPSVLVSTAGKDLGFPNLSSVATDDVEAAKCAMNYLVNQGHVHIGVIGGNLSSSYVSEQRYIGCEKCFGEKGRIFDYDKYFVKARFDFGSAYRATEKLLEKAKDMTAIFAMSDVMAIGAIRAIRDRGLLVPDDISVVGFDGIPMADYYNPKLTTVRQRYQTMARRSLEILFRTIDLKTKAVHEIIPFELALGESVREIGK